MSYIPGDEDFQEIAQAYAPQAQDFGMQQEQPQQQGDLRSNLMNMFLQSIGGASRQMIGQAPGAKLLPEGLTGGYAEQLPRSLAEGLKNITGKAGLDVIPEIMPGQPAQSFSEMLGQGLGKGAAIGTLAAPFVMGGEALAPGLIGQLGGAFTGGAALAEPGQSLKGGLEFALPVPVMRALAPAAKVLAKNLNYGDFKNLVTKIKPEEVYGGIQKTYDKYRGDISGIFDFVSKEGAARGIKSIDELPVNAFNEVLEFGPKNKSFRDLVAKAETGEYDYVRKLYTALGNLQQKARKGAPITSEAEAAYREAQDTINDALGATFQKTGNPDLNQWLDVAKSGWKQLKDIFEPEYNSMLKNLVARDRKIPDTLNPLFENRDSIRNLFEKMPELERIAELYKQKKAISDSLKKGAKIGGSIGAGYYGLNKISGDKDEE